MVAAVQGKDHIRIVATKTRPVLTAILDGRGRGAYCTGQTVSNIRLESLGLPAVEWVDRGATLKDFSDSRVEIKAAAVKVDRELEPLTIAEAA